MAASDISQTAPTSFRITRYQLNILEVVTRIVILTGSELRHTFFRIALSCQPGIDILRSHCEGREKSLDALVDRNAPDAQIQLAHVASRAQSERDVFGTFVTMVPDRSRPMFMRKGDINLPQHVQHIIGLGPDLIVAYGCSIIKPPLIDAFAGRFLNVHLGLSPYYRGSGTNFWPLVNGEPEYVGATFMHIDRGVDTGEIIHQIRADVFPDDTPHQIGNRLIGRMTETYSKIIMRLAELDKLQQQIQPARSHYYRRSDFTPQAVRQLYQHFENGLVERYLAEANLRIHRAPILANPRMTA